MNNNNKKRHLVWLDNVAILLGAEQVPSSVDNSLLHQSACNNSSTVERLIRGMDSGNDFGSEDGALVGDGSLVDSETSSTTQGSATASDKPSPLLNTSNSGECSQAPMLPPAHKKANKQTPKKRQPSQ
ncbi:uncharacterized protein LOC142573254 [Dermacentor variabilis]|uniref:uncharacterized protein LOC142573254 n=1 Tax=Dermacentor variabilis TaxID=34621 RepID=UPI003F5B61E3